MPALSATCFGGNAGNIAAPGTGMDIGGLGSPSLIIKRKFRWVCSIYPCGELVNPLPPYLVKIASRPDLTIEETELNFLNEKIWIPGKAMFETTTITFIDASESEGNEANVNGRLLGWIASVYDFMDPNCRHQNSRRKDYVGRVKLDLLDGCGKVLERWDIGDAWPTSVKFGELDYSSSDTLDVELTIRYSRVQYTNFCGAQPSRCPCFSCSAANVNPSSSTP